MSDIVKVIIEIPAELYARIKNGGGWTCLNECRECIENGIPLDDVKAEIEKAKQYKGENANPAVEKHNIGLDKYYDKGLDKALKILDNIGKAESEE